MLGFKKIRPCSPIFANAEVAYLRVIFVMERYGVLMTSAPAIL